MRLGIFGGSFDPVHNGHLELARCCQQQAELEEVWFTPAAKQPLKPDGPQASDQHRCAMLALAITEDPDWSLCRQEIDRGGTSFTADTLQTVHQQHPDARLFFLMGADALHELPLWHAPKEICRLATPLVVRRAGEAEPDFTVLEQLVGKARQKEIEQQQIEMLALPVSSRDIRHRIAEGAPIDGLVPPAVIAYLRRHPIYRE